MSNKDKFIDFCKSRCWEGYEPVPGKKPYSEDSCRPKGSKAKKSEKKVKAKVKKKDSTLSKSEDKKPLNKPIRDTKGGKKFKVHVKDPKTGNTKTVRFGDANMEIKRDDKDRRKNFRARHNCDNPGPKTKARYWSCKTWQKDKTVKDVTGKK